MLQHYAKLQVAKKHKTATSEKWKVPGIMGGNAVPGWEDQQGSIVRRIMLFLFNTPVVEVDTMLPSKLLAELPIILVKSNKAYIEAVRIVGSRSIWANGILPQYFHNTRAEMAQIVNSMQGFLASDVVQYDPTYYCPLSELKSAWQKWVADMNISPKPTWKPDLYMNPLQARQLRIAKEYRVYPRGTGSGSRQQYVIGVDLTSEVASGNENFDPNRG